MTPTNTRKTRPPPGRVCETNSNRKEKTGKDPKKAPASSCSLFFLSLARSRSVPFFCLLRHRRASSLSLFSLSSLSLFFHLLKVWQLAPNAFGFLLVSSFFFEREGRAREKREREERERREKREDRHCARAWLWRERRKRRERERREREKREREEKRLILILAQHGGRGHEC